METPPRGQTDTTENITFPTTTRVGAKVEIRKPDICICVQKNLRCYINSEDSMIKCLHRVN